MSEGITNRQLLVVALTTATLMLAVAGGFSWYVGTQIQKLTDLANSTNSAVQSVLQLVEVGPDGIKEVAGAVAEGASTTGEAVGEALGGDVGEGAATAVERIGGAWKKFTVTDPTIGDE